MLQLTIGEGGDIVLAGRFDASQEKAARAFFESVEGSRVVDLSRLEYISSAGLAVLLTVQKRLRAAGGGLRIAGVSRQIREMLRFSGFDRIFEIEE